MPLGTDVDLVPGHIVLDGAQYPPSKRGTAAPSFRPMSIVAKQSPISATGELLLLLTWNFVITVMEFKTGWWCKSVV